MAPELATHPGRYNAMPENDQYRLQHGWARHVADQFGLELVNLAFNGMSLQSMIWTALWWVNNHDVSDSLAIAALTLDHRTSWYLDNVPGRTPEWNMHIHSAWEQTVGHCGPIKQHYFQYSQGAALDQYHRQQAILCFDGIADRHQIPVIQFDIHPAQTPYYGKQHAYVGEAAWNWVEDNHAKNKHPNEQGHVLIANRLISWIKSVKLMG
jgi:hypothetical protein